MAKQEVDFHIHRSSVSVTLPVSSRFVVRAVFSLEAFRALPMDFISCCDLRHPAQFPQSTDTNPDRTSRSSGRRVVSHSFFCFPCLTHLLSQENRLPVSRGWIPQRGLSLTYPFLLLITVYFVFAFAFVLHLSFWNAVVTIKVDFKSIPWRWQWL